MSDPSVSDPRISADDPYPRNRVAVLDSEISYIDAGSGSPVVFLHGNGTFSYLWRNIIPHVEPLGRCLAPDLLGTGRSGDMPGGSYRFIDHARYLDAWFDAVAPGERITLVIHDWGGPLGFHWANRHRERVRGIVYLETFVTPVRWEDWPESRREVFSAFRSPQGEEMVLRDNLFIETMPDRILRGLTEEERRIYGQRYREPGEARRPTLTWTRECPIGGEPADVVEIVTGYGEWLAGAAVPKLFINGDPGSILTGRQRAFCRRWPNQTELTVRGIHYLQEDSPHEIGRAVAQFLGALDPQPLRRE